MWNPLSLVAASEVPRPRDRVGGGEPEHGLVEVNGPGREGRSGSQETGKAGTAIGRIATSNRKPPRILAGWPYW